MANEEDFTMETIVGSSRIIAIGYDQGTKEMRAQFPNGAVYSYSNVPESVYGAVRYAPSVGSSFHELIVGGGYAYERIS